MIAIADDGHNTEFVLDDTKTQDVGGPAAAAKDDNDDKPAIRSWMLNVDANKNNDGYKYEDIGPHTVQQLMEYFKLYSKDFSYGMETHGVNRFASNGQLMPYHVVEQRRFLAECKVPNNKNNWSTGIDCSTPTAAIASSSCRL